MRRILEDYPLTQFADSTILSDIINNAIDDSKKYNPDSKSGLCSDILSSDMMSVDQVARIVVDDVFFPELPYRPDGQNRLSTQLAARICSACVVSNFCSDQIIDPENIFQDYS